MADWFKFYNDGLDSAGLQYCISEQPLVTSVWLVILSEASKNRSSKLPWDDKDFRLLGYARKVNVSPGVFNQSINLLQSAGYVKLEDGFLTIPGWESMQSNYAKGLNRGYYKDTNKTLVSNSQVSTVRGEEKRGEEKGAKAPALELASPEGQCPKEPDFPYAETPSWDEFWQHCQTIGMHGERYARDKFLAAEQENWKRQENWRAYVARVKTWWESDGRPMDKPTEAKVEVKKPVGPRKFMGRWDVDHPPQRSECADDNQYESFCQMWKYFFEKELKAKRNGGSK